MKKYLTVFILFFCIVSAYAVSVSSLYSVTVPVATRTDTLDPNVLKTAFSEVLIKVSGKANIITEDAIASALNKAGDYVQDYSYSTENNNLSLTIRFAKTSITDLLKQADEPVWGNDRPLTLVWVLNKNNIVGNEANNPIIQALNNAASLRGMPISFPILDLTDYQNISADDLWVPMIAPIIKASNRYQPDAILVVAINGLTARVTLELNGQVMHWQTTGTDLQQILTAGIDNVADALASQYAVSSVDEQDNEVTITVANLNGVDDYAKVQRYLSGISGVKNVQALSVNTSFARFHLDLSTPIFSFEQQIKLGKILQPISKQDQAEMLNLPEDDIVYQYNGDSTL